MTVVTDLATGTAIWFNKEVDTFVVPGDEFEALALQHGLRPEQVGTRARCRVKRRVVCGVCCVHVLRVQMLVCAHVRRTGGKGGEGDGDGAGKMGRERKRARE
eukprot:1743723-Rhodomonas_salina.1